ncbi:MAG TPA: hypothetical protein VJS92_11540, partial [Candidatus Polarisedimenticolaceae bacterium]|nr:hypothetical protein [Candidatus Polarisedimenticolaceae bacterium]
CAALLGAADFAEGPVLEVALVGEPDDPGTHALLAVVRRKYRPNLVLAQAREGSAPPRAALLRDKHAQGGRATAFVCRRYVCRQPTTSPQELEQLLDSV